MSRNFELLSRAKEGEELFLPVIDDLPRGLPCPPRDRETVRREVVELDKAEVPWSGRELSGPEQQEFAKLVNRVFMIPNSHAPRAVTFCDVEGKASGGICLGAGEVLATRGSASVCLVDANFQRPSLHLFCGIARSPGLSEAMASKQPIKDFMVHISRGNLWVLPPGARSGGAQVLLSSDRLRSRIAELRATFDYVLIDAPAVSSCGDAILLGQMVEGVILVVEAHSTRRESARMAKEALEQANVRLFGAILNNRTFPIPEALYRRL